MGVVKINEKSKNIQPKILRYYNRVCIIPSPVKIEEDFQINPVLFEIFLSLRISGLNCIGKVFLCCFRGFLHMFLVVILESTNKIVIIFPTLKLKVLK